jgi:hypothetical protein
MTLFASLSCCALRDDERRENVAAAHERFESADATLFDFEMDGRLVADTSDPAALRSLVHVQLMFAVGQLNGESSVGWYERLEISALSASPLTGSSARYDVRYHAKLPVAWGGAPTMAGYTLVLPIAVGPADQERFTAKYASTCVDPEGGDLNAGSKPDAGRMFLFYRPQKSGCALAPSDVVKIAATMTRSNDNSAGKYPEYHRIWEDGALDFVAIFGIENEDSTSDAGATAFDDFTRRAGAHVASLQSDDTKRTSTRTVVDGKRRVHIEATLSGDRAVHVDAILIGQRLDGESASFDAWYNALSAKADVIYYSGHAAHGANIHSLMTKGTFEPRKYLMWIANGCDSLAYLDRTLAERRAQLNPNDAPGTKYMDVISNVRGPWFREGDETAMRFFRDVVAASGARPAPKTYREILSAIDPEQVIVVTGEEDNEFLVSSTPTPMSGPNGNAPATARQGPNEPVANDSSDSGCDVPSRRADARTGVLLVLVIAGAFARRRSATGAPRERRYEDGAP